jgi:hypothetical protein
VTQRPARVPAHLIEAGLNGAADVAGFVESHRGRLEQLDQSGFLPDLLPEATTNGNAGGLAKSAGIRKTLIRCRECPSPPESTSAP